LFSSKNNTHEKKKKNKEHVTGEKGGGVRAYCQEAGERTMLAPRGNVLNSKGGEVAKKKREKEKETHSARKRKVPHQQGVDKKAHQLERGFYLGGGGRGGAPSNET